MTQREDPVEDDGSMGSIMRSWTEERRYLRGKYGIECPECKRLRPKTCATILLPQQQCRVDGYRDPRPYDTIPDEERIWKRTKHI